MTLFLPFLIFALKKIPPGNLIIQNWQERLIGRLEDGSRKEQSERERHARGEGVLIRKTHKNRFPTPYPITCSRCVMCQKFWQKTIDITQTKRAKALYISRWSVARAFPSKCLSKLRVLGHRQK